MDWHWVILAVGAAFVPYVRWFDLYHGQVDFMLLVCIVTGLYGARLRVIWTAR